MKVTKYDLTGTRSSETQVHDLKENEDIGIGNADDASSLQVTTVISCGGVSYTAQKIPHYDLRLIDSATWHMLTCFQVKNDSLTPEGIQATRDDFDRKDDVFCSSFLKTIVLITDEPCVSDAVIKLFKSWGCLTVYKLPKNYDVSPGPYLYSASGIFWAWRLFADDHEAFVLSTIPSQSDRTHYETLNAATSEASSLSIAVPSRLYFRKSEKLPFAGLRVSIKDVFHLKGVHTGAGNRAYRRLYPAQTYTSAVVQRAIELGAIIVGKAKTAEFAGSQEVIGDWSDYSYAFNARADGYLASTGSSTGSASGLAAYPWLDFSIGSDAGGSIRDPSVVHGIYGFRPTHNGSATKDAVIPCPIFQVPGFMGRSSKGMLEFGRYWLTSGTEASLRSGKLKLWFPPEYHSDRPDVQAEAENILLKLAKHLDADISHQALEDVWDKTKPSGISDSFQTYFKKTFMDVLKHEYWEYTATFRNDFADKFHVTPYVCKTTQWIWSDGSSTKPARKIDALHEVHTHNEWFLSNVFNSKNTLMVCPRYNLNHRDEYLPPPTEREYYGFDSNLHASLAGLPNLIVPVGECQYYSPISKTDVLFPISLSIVGSKGTDIALIRMVNEFQIAAGIPTSVATGTKTF